MRNNEERLGVMDEGQTPPPPANLGIPSSPPAGASAAMSFVTPTEFVELPTQGKFYPEGHPLHGEETVEIKFMTAKEEDILTSKSLLKKGVAIDRLLQNLIVDKRIKVGDLFSGDRNAILVAARISGYGPEYDTKVTCPNCGETDRHLFNLEEVSATTVEDLEEVWRSYDVTYNSENNTIVIKLPKTKAAVECRLTTGADESALVKKNDKRKKHKLGHDTLMTDQFKRFIYSVNDNTSSGYINQFVDHLPVLDSRELRLVYSKCVPNVDMTQDFSCNACGYEQAMEVPFTTDFFWPK